jgi:Glycosyltransferase 61
MRPRGTLVLQKAAVRLAAKPLYGAYEADGPIDKHTLRWAAAVGKMGAVPSEFPEMEVTEECDEEVVWGGMLGKHYGHFLLELVSRLWPLVDGGPLEGRRVVFGGAQDPELPAVSEWLDGFGVRIKKLPEKGAVRFTRMFVPELACKLNTWCCPEIRDIHLQARSGMNITPTNHDEVLWLSRSELPAERAPYDECLFEWLLGDRVTVIHPEQLTLAEQVAALEGSKAVVGVVGSAFHTMLLTQRTPDCLYLCAQMPKSSLAAQHHFLECDATFAMQTLEVAARQRKVREEMIFPTGHRVVIPEALQALNTTVLPGLLDDPKLSRFAYPERSQSKRNRPSAEDLDAAVMRVLVEPFSVDAREKLGAAFAERGLDRNAGEQLRMVADLTDAR